MEAATATNGFAAAALAEALTRASDQHAVVLLELTDGWDASALMRRLAELHGAGRRASLVRAEPFDAEALAARILEALGAPAFEAPQGVLRDYVAHLRCERLGLVLVVQDAGALTPGAAAWLGSELRTACGALRLVLASTGDARLPAVLDALGLETVRVAAAPVSDRPARQEAAAASRVGRAVKTKPPERPPQRPRDPSSWIPSPLGLFAAVALGWAAALLSISLGWLRWDEPPTPAPPAASAPRLQASAHPPKSPPAAPLPDPGAGSAPPSLLAGFEFDSAHDRISFEVRGAPLGDVLAELAQRLTLSIGNPSGERFQRSVTLAVDDLPLESALHLLLRDYSTTFVYTSNKADGAPRLASVIVVPEAALGEAEDGTAARERIGRGVRGVRSNYARALERAASEPR